jgi:hypothetical protein
MTSTLKSLLAAAGALTPSLARDALGVGGLAAITYGAWLIYRPAGFIIGGLFAVVAAALLAALDQKGSS